MSKKKANPFVSQVLFHVPMVPGNVKNPTVSQVHAWNPWQRGYKDVHAQLSLD